MHQLVFVVSCPLPVVRIGKLKTNHFSDLLLAADILTLAVCLPDGLSQTGYFESLAAIVATCLP